MKKDTTRRNLILIIIALAVAIVAVSAMFVFFAFGDSAKIQRNMRNAQRYLEELDYEQAEAAYQDVLKIDPQNVEAYLGLVEVYTATEDYDAALECAKEGYEVTRDERLNDKIEEIGRSEENNLIESDSRKEAINEIDEDQSIEHKKSKEEISEYLSFVLSAQLPDYTYDSVSDRTLLYFAYNYLYMYGECEIVDNYTVYSGNDINNVLENYFDKIIPLQTIGEIEFKNGGFYFPLVDIGWNGYPIAIIEDVKQNHNLYTVDFYDTWIYPENSENGTDNPTSIEDYYGYSVEDMYNDEFCDIRGKMTCVLEEKDGRLIIKNYITRMVMSETANITGTLACEEGHILVKLDNMIQFSVDEDIYEVDEVGITGENSQYDLVDLTGKRVLVSGYVMNAHTAYHYSTIMILDGAVSLVLLE